MINYSVRVGESVVEWSNFVQITVTLDTEVRLSLGTDHSVSQFASLLAQDQGFSQSRLFSSTIPELTIIYTGK